MRKFSIILLYFLFGTISALFSQYRYGYLDMGRSELMRNNYDDAIQYFNKYIEMLPTRFEGYYLRGISKYYLDDYAGAEDDFTKAINRLPEFPELYLLRAIVRSERLEYSNALKDFNMAISLDSTYTNAYYYRALTYFNLGNYNKALTDCNKVLKLNKNYRNIYVLHGVILSRLGKYNEAITDLCYSIQQNPGNTAAYVERGAAYMGVDKTHLAMQDFQHALKLDSLNTYALFQRGLAWMKLQEYQKALEDFNHVLRLSPDNQLAYFNRAIINANTNDQPQALSDLLSILRRNPKNMLVYYNLGLTLTSMKKYKEAIQSFDQAIKLYPDYADAYYGRARARQAMGDIAGAIHDNDLADKITKQNHEKSDTTKFKEGLKILKLTHLSADFTDTKDKKDKPQYAKGDIKLKSFYGLVFNPVAGEPIVAYDCHNKKYYGTKTIALLPMRTDSVSSDALRKIAVADSALKKGHQDAFFYLHRGVLYTKALQYAKALADIDTAHARNTQNILVFFARANVRLAMLDSYFSDSATGILSYDKKDWIQTVYSHILVDYNTVITLDPGFYYALYNRGYAKFLMQDYEGALSDFKKSQEKMKFPEASYNEGLMNILLGHKEAGCMNLSAAGSAGIRDAYKVIRKYCN